MVILVMSDDLHLREEASLAFPPDVEVLLAHDFDEAWDLLESRAPQALVVDLRSGNAGGYNLLMAKSQRPELLAIPSLMLLERDQDRWLAEQAGATACLTKPVEAIDLAAETLALLPV
jgi:DNA-binding response OmpR family regulator